MLPSPRGGRPWPEYCNDRNPGPVTTGNVAFGPTLCPRLPAQNWNVGQRSMRRLPSRRSVDRPAFDGRGTDRILWVSLSIAVQRDIYRKYASVKSDQSNVQFAERIMDVSSYPTRRRSPYSASRFRREVFRRRTGLKPYDATGQLSIHGVTETNQLPAVD